MNKIVILLILVLSLMACSSKMTADGSTSYKNKKFGNDTMKLISKGQYLLACNDAKMAYSMVDAAMQDFEQAEVEGATDIDNMTPAMIEFSDSIEDLGVQIEAIAGDNSTLNEQILNGVGEGIAKIFQVSLVNIINIVTKEEIKEYIDIEFCGKKAPKGWISPIEL